MKPDAIFDFEKLSNSKTRYILRRETGIYIADFPSIWIAEDHPYKGKKYISLTEYWGQQIRPSTYGYTHMLSFGQNKLEKDKGCIGLNFLPDFPCKTFGVFMNDAILVELSEDWNKMTIYYFKDKGKMAHSLFKEWTSGELKMTLEDDDLTIPA